MPLLAVPLGSFEYVELSTPLGIQLSVEETPENQGS